MLCMGLMAGAAFAKVPAAEADKLGKELTCTGAIKAGNADGSIPAFTGKILGVPPGVKFTKSVGQFQPDIYANEKPVVEITAANMAQYADKLSDGQKALLKLTAEQQGGKLDDLRARIGDRVAIARERLADAEAAIVDTGRKAVRVTDDYVHENPWQSVGVAAGVAFLLGLLVSRR